MKLQIELLNEGAEKQIIHFKEYLLRAQIDGLEELEIDRADHEKGQMGIGTLMASVTALVTAAVVPLSKLVDVLALYVQSFNSEVKIKNQFGDELILSTRKIDKEGINYLVEQFLYKEGRLFSKKDAEIDSDTEEKASEELEKSNKQEYLPPVDESPPKEEISVADKTSAKKPKRSKKEPKE